MSVCHSSLLNSLKTVALQVGYTKSVTYQGFTELTFVNLITVPITSNLFQSPLYTNH